MNNQKMLALGCQRYVEDIIRTRLEKINDGMTLTPPKSFDEEMEAYITGLDAEKEKIISLYRRKKKAKKVIKVLLIAALFAALMLLTAYSAGKIVNYYSTVYSDHTDLYYNFFKNENKGKYGDFFYGKINYIPEGYVFRRKEGSSMSQLLEYSNGKSRITLFSGKNGGTTGVNTENCELVEIEINGNPGFWYDTGTDIGVGWNTGHHNHMLITSAAEGDKPSLEEMIKIAEDVTPAFPRFIDRIIDFL